MYQAERLPDAADRWANLLRCSQDLSVRLTVKPGSETSICILYAVLCFDFLAKALSHITFAAHHSFG